MHVSTSEASSKKLKSQKAVVVINGSSFSTVVYIEQNFSAISDWCILASTLDSLKSIHLFHLTSIASLLKYIYEY
jgi:hypothetical protein